MIRGVVFDFDGTLVDSNDIKVQTFYEVTKPYDPSGSIVSRVLKKFPNKDRYGLFHEISRELCNKGQLVLSEESSSVATQWVEDYTVRCEESIEKCEEVQGASEILQWISKQHLPIFINSRTPAKTLKRLVTLRSLHSYVSDVYGAPATKTENLRRIETQVRANPSELLFVGDSEDDREASLNVGCHFVGVVLRDTPRFSGHLPERWITNLWQLQPIVEALHK